MSIFLNVFVVFLVIGFVYTANILAVFPVPSISHQVVFRPITQELSKRGHDVTMITPDPAFKKGQTPPGLTEIDVHDVSYKIWAETFMKESKGNKNDGITQIELFYKLFTLVFDVILENEEVQILLSGKTKEFDMLLLEAGVRPTLGFSYIFKTPVVLISSLGAAAGNYELLGASEHPILYPNVFHQKLYNLTMWEKITKFFISYTFTKVHQKNAILENQVLRKHFGPDIPPVEELVNNIDLLLINTNPVFDGSRPVPANIIYMGGIHQTPEKPLPADLKNYLDSSRNGVIYVSFGTNVDTSLLPIEKVKILVTVFSKLSYDVLLKWNSAELPGHTDNIKVSTWLPQADLLKHPNVKLFITQGGLQSTDEAITAGVPLIGIPMLGDQWYNVQKYVYHGIGEELQFQSLTEENLMNTINTVLSNESYRHNIIRLRTLMLDQPMKPLERAIWWIEYVLRHGGAKHMRAPTANISWSQYLELELVFIVLIAFLFFATLLLAGLFLLYKYILSSFFARNVKQKFKIT